MEEHSFKIVIWYNQNSNHEEMQQQYGMAH
jgi:hypothetical protein